MATPEEAAKRLKDIAARCRDLSPASEIVAQKVKAFIDKRFDNSIDTSGSPFSPLSEATKKIDPSRTNGLPLVKRKNLQNSIRVEANPDGISISTPVVYANAQNYGNPDNRVFGKAPGPLPARKFLPVNRDLTLDTRGEAGDLWAEVKQDLLNYILDGDI